MRAHSTLHALAAFAEPGLLDLANRNVNNEDKRTARLPPLNNPDTAIYCMGISRGQSRGTRGSNARLTLSPPESICMYKGRRDEIRPNDADI